MKRRKKTTDAFQDRTKYYRAIYMTSDGSTVQEVFVSTDISDAREFAAGKNSFGRQLMDLEEFNELIDALL
jgi:hypothetical protein